MPLSPVLPSALRGHVVLIGSLIEAIAGAQSLQNGGTLYRTQTLLHQVIKTSLPVALG